MKKDYDWIRLVINSCANGFQLDCCHSMIFLYRQKYSGVPGVEHDYDALLEEIAKKHTAIGIEV